MKMEEEKNHVRTLPQTSSSYMQQPRSYLETTQPRALYLGSISLCFEFNSIILFLHIDLEMRRLLSIPLSL